MRACLPIPAMKGCGEVAKRLNFTPGLEVAIQRAVEITRL